MFCTYCGKEISNEAKFCRFCGTPVVALKTPAVSEPVEIKEEPVEIKEEPVEVKEEPAEVMEEPVEIKEEAPTAPPEAFYEISEVEKEVAEARAIEEMIEKIAEEPAEEKKEENPAIWNPAVSYIPQPVQQVPEKPKKKISPIVWVAIGAGVLLIIAFIIIITLIGKLNKVKDNEPIDEPTYSDYSDTEKSEADNETPVNSEYPELSHEYDDFLNSTSFNSDAVLGEGEILYMGEAFYDGIGECHVTFALTSDRKTVKNFAIYLNEISLELSQGIYSYSLDGVSIRQDYSNTFDYTDDYIDIALGDNTMYGFYLDTESYSSAYCEFDYSFTYYPPALGGSTSTPIETYLGISEVVFEPVMIG